MQRGKKPISWYFVGWFIFEFVSRLSRNWYNKLEMIYKLEHKSGKNVVEHN